MFHIEKYLMVSCLSLELDVSGKCYREYGSGSTCHRRFQEWRQCGIFDRLWTRLLKIYDNKRRGIKWSWQSLDSISVKSPLGGR